VRLERNHNIRSTPNKTKVIVHNKEEEEVVVVVVKVVEVIVNNRILNPTLSYDAVRCWPSASPWRN
jgi:hypothetical protein